MLISYMVRKDVLKILREDVAKAKEQARIASEHFDAAIKDPPNGIPHPDGTQYLRNASNEYSACRTRLMYTISRLNAFVIHGTVPDDLKD
jgi:hypothetical protein